MSGSFSLVHGDIADARADAIVNAWNRNFIPHWLLLPQGVSKALKRKGGVEIFREVRRHGLLPLGGAVATTAGALEAQWVIHVAALHAYWVASKKSVTLGAQNAYQLAQELGVQELAMPLLGAGTGALSAVDSLTILYEQWLATSEKPESVTVFIYDQKIYQRCEPALEKLKARGS